jgi:hypothetical protein
MKKQTYTIKFLRINRSKQRNPKRHTFYFGEIASIIHHEKRNASSTYIPRELVRTLLSRTGGLSVNVKSSIINTSGR